MQPDGYAVLDTETSTWWRNARGYCVFPSKHSATTAWQYVNKRLLEVDERYKLIPVRLEAVRNGKA